MQRPVLIAVRGLDAVGIGRQVELLAAGLAAAGHHVHTVVTTTGGSLPDRLAATGIPVHRIGRRPVADAAAAAGFTRLAARLGPATVLSFGRRQAWLAAVARIVVPGLRAVAHVAVPAGRPLGWRLRRMDRVVATSPVVAESCRRLGVDASQIATVAPGIVTATPSGLSRAEIARLLGLDPAAEWTLCVTPLVAESRLERLLWGIDQLGVVRGGMQHVLVGAGPLLSRVWRRARVQELAERLRVVAACPVIADVVGAARLVWQPGPVACGGAILDAMALGVPAVAVESDAARQLIEDRETGWIVPPLPESEFPRRAFNTLEDPALAARQGAAARARAAQVFPAERMVAGFAAVLDSLP